MTLHTPVNDTTARAYCGPFSIAVLTGYPISIIRKRIRRVRGDYDRKHYGRVVKGGNVTRSDGRKRRIAGTSNHEVLTVLKRLGMRIVDQAKNKRFMTDRETLREFCEDRAHLGPTLIEAGHHYVVVSRGMICDTFTKHPIPWKDYPKLGMRVASWWTFAEKKSGSAADTLPDRATRDKSPCAVTAEAIT